MTYPFWCLAVAGALCLVRQRTVGFYLIYAYFALSLFGIGVSFLAGFSFFPLLERIAHLGPMQPVLHFGFNLLVIVVLLWSHYHLAPATCLFRAATCRTERKLIHPHQTVPMSRDTGGLVARRHGQVARATIGLNCMAKS
jgi:hypothetical protein